MATEKTGYVSGEKGDVSPPDNQADIETGEIRRHSYDDHGRKFSLTGRKSSVAETIIAADLLDDRYATTQRGLKSRHAQMIALGGTIGTGYARLSLINVQSFKLTRA